MYDYLKNRLKEPDTRAVLWATLYTLLRPFTPPQYAPFLDVAAAALGVKIAATPSTQPPR